MGMPLIVSCSRQQQTNALFANQWRPCEQNNYIINVCTMITIIGVSFKIYMTNTDKQHVLVSTSNLGIKVPRVTKGKEGTQVVQFNAL